MVVCQTRSRCATHNQTLRRGTTPVNSDVVLVGSLGTAVHPLAIEPVPNRWATPSARFRMFVGIMLWPRAQKAIVSAAVSFVPFPILDLPQALLGYLLRPVASQLPARLGVDAPRTIGAFILANNRLDMLRRLLGGITDCLIPTAHQPVIHFGSGYGRSIIKVGCVLLTLATT